MRKPGSIDVVVTAVVTVVIFAIGPYAQVAPPHGAASPQEAVATLIKANAANNLLPVLRVISPNGLKQLANEGVSGVLIMLAFSDPDDGMPGMSKPSKAELDATRKKYRQAVDLITVTLKPYGVDTLIGKPILGEETQKSLDAALDKADNAALITSLFGAMIKIGPLLGMKQEAKLPQLVKLGTVTGYKIDGDKATAQNGAETIDFVRLDGRWYIEPPASDRPGASPSSTQSSAAPAQGGQTAARSTASGKVPEIVVGGIQIARVVVSDNDFSAKPFNGDNGTTILLWVKMPAGQGLIAIDEDESLLQSVTDDKGANLGGKFESFPDEFKDASGGTIEIRSTGFAAPDATAILVAGSVAMTVATATRKTRVAKVQLQNGAKFSFLKTSITVAEVQTEEGAQTFTLQLPREVMEGIKEIVFLDAKGQPVEGRRTGSGYMNDAGEMTFSVKTALKTLTLEFEAWQGLRTIKVPFKVKAGIGLQ